MPIHVNGFGVSGQNPPKIESIPWRATLAAGGEITIPSGVTMVNVVNTEATPILFAKGSAADPTLTIASAVSSAGMAIEAGGTSIGVIAVTPGDKVKAVATT